MSSPHVSILIPTFNSGRWIERAIHSALEQTWTDLEVIVHDNASTDDTLERSLACAQQDPRVQVHSSESNEGPVVNWRRCAALARGRYSGLLFSDDWYESHFVARALEQLTPTVGFVVSQVRIVNEASGTSEVEHYFGNVDSGPQPSARYLFGQLTLADFKLPVSPGCALMRTPDLVRALNSTLPSFHATRALKHGAGPDLLVGLQLATRYPQVAYVAEPLVNFRWHDSNLSQRPEIAAAYELARNDFFDAVHPAAVCRGDHLARRIYLNYRNRKAMASLGVLPKVNPLAVNWLACGQYARWRLWQQAQGALPQLFSRTQATK